MRVLAREVYGLLLAFFFASGRRHTTCVSDWSSDVCSSDLVAAREKVYASMFGDAWTVDRGEEGDGPAIDVYTFEPEDEYKRDFYTLITGGMADERMRVGEEEREVGRERSGVAEAIA